MKSKIVGIDPGSNTGIAVIYGGVLTNLFTIDPAYIIDRIQALCPDRVIFEDSRLQSHVWTARSKSSTGAALATARSLGQVDAWCNLITEECEVLRIPAHGISPAAKGAKLNAKQFAAITGWTEKCNQHTRDAAMVAWPYRFAQKSP